MRTPIRHAILILAVAFLAAWITRQPQPAYSGLLVSSAEAQDLPDELQPFAGSLVEVPPAPQPTVRRRIYVPAYSSIRTGSGRGQIHLAVTLSLRNTSSERPLVVERIDYHDTSGALLRRFVSEPIAIRPLGTVEAFIPADELSGGTGANFVIDWAGESPMADPIAEAVMIGWQGTTSYSFVSRGETVGMIGAE